MSIPTSPASLGLTTADLFNLTIYDAYIKFTEIYSNLTIKDTPPANRSLLQRLIHPSNQSFGPQVGSNPRAIFIPTPSTSPQNLLRRGLGRGLLLSRFLCWRLRWRRYFLWIDQLSKFVICGIYVDSADNRLSILG
jgi:hypothetical protein